MRSARLLSSSSLDVGRATARDGKGAESKGD